MKRLRDYQKLALDIADPYDNFAFYLSMRLGKSLLSIRFMKQREAKTVLLIAPLYSFPGWKDELEEERLKFNSLRDHHPRENTWNVINPEFLVREANRSDFLANFPFDGIVLDESAVVRNPNTQISKLLTSYKFADIPYRCMLSGKPAPESNLEYAQQFIFLKGSFCGFNNFYALRNCLYTQVGYDWHSTKKARKLIKKELSEQALFMTKEELGIANEIIIEKKYCYLPPSDINEYRIAERSFKLGDRLTKYRVVVDNWLRQIAGGRHKDRLLLQVLETELPEDEPVIIWFNYNQEIVRVFKLLERKGYKVAAITGKTPQKERRRIKRKLDKGKIQIILHQLKCGKYSLNYSSCDTFIYFSCSYSSEEYDQTLARGQDTNPDRSILVVHLITRDSIDEDIQLALTEKDVNSSSVVKAAARRTLKRLSRNWKEKLP